MNPHPAKPTAGTSVGAKSEEARPAGHGVPFPVPVPIEDEFVDDELSDFCVAVQRAAAERLRHAPSVEEEEDDLAPSAAPTPLPARLQARLAAAPDQFPGASVRKALFHRHQEQEGTPPEKFVALPMRSEPRLRAMACTEYSCCDREHEVDEGVGFLSRQGCRVLIISGAPGIGKTALACEIARHFASLQANLRTLTDSNTRFFNCVGLDTQREISGLLLSQFSNRPAAILPEDMPARFSVLGRHLATYLRGLPTALWTFDGLDEYLCAVARSRRQITFTAQMTGVCARAASNLKAIITVREEPAAPLLRRLFGASFYLQRLQVQTAPEEGDVVLPALAMPAAVHQHGAPTAAAHPLAHLLSEAAFERLPCRPDEQMPLFKDPDICPAVLLGEACRTSWNALTEEERGMLKVCRELPGGVWFPQPSEGRGGQEVDWAEVFGDERWKDRLASLQTMQWLTVQTDRSETFGCSQLYRLRPALSPFVRRRTGADEHQDIGRRLVYFWARNLKRWSHAIAGRLTDHIEPRLPAAAGRQTLLLAEENARYLIDVNRLNWLLSYRHIPACAPPRDVVALHYFYLRGTICFCRMTGSLTLFEGMVDRALRRIQTVPADPAARPWRQVAREVYTAACHDMRGRTLRRLGRPEPGLVSLGCAEHILRGQSGHHARVRHELAWTLTEQGRIHHEQGRWEKAAGRLEEAIHIRRGLVKEVEDRLARAGEQPGGRPGACHLPARLEKKRAGHLRCLATSLNIRGNVCNERFEWTQAERLHHDALSIRQHLKESHSYYFQRYIAHCRNDYANTLYYQGRYAEALEHYTAALAIRETLVPQPENGLGEYVARTLNNCGNTHRKFGDWTRARQCLERAVTIYRACVLELPNRFKSLLARTLTNLGRVYYHQGLLREALAVLEEADRLHMASKGTANPFKWVETCNCLAEVHLEIHDHKYALRILAQAERLLERKADHCTINHTWHLAYSLNTKARVLLRSPEEAAWTEAERLLRRSETLRHGLPSALRATGALELPLAQNWHDLGVTLGRLRRRGEAESYLRDALELRRRKASSNPGYAGRLVARSATELADIYVQVDRSEEAILLYQEAHVIFHKLHQANPRGFKNELSRVNASLETLDHTTCVEWEAAG